MHLAAERLISMSEDEFTKLVMLLGPFTLSTKDAGLNTDLMVGEDWERVTKYFASRCEFYSDVLLVFALRLFMLADETPRNGFSKRDLEIIRRIKCSSG